MEPSHDIDELVEASRMGHVKTGEHVLWRTVLNLESWYFVADRTGEEGEPLVAMAEAEQGAGARKPHLLAFTDEVRAKAVSEQRARQKGGEATPVLHMDVPDALAYCADLAERGVEGVLFNSGAYAFSTGMASLGEMGDRYRA